MKKRRVYRWALSAAGFAGILGAAWLVFGDPAPAGAQYRTAAAAVDTIESSVTALGTLEPKDSVDVGAQVSGQLQVLHVEAGDRVAKGDLLAEIDARVLKARVDAGRAGLKELEATLAQHHAEARLAKAQAARNQRLLKADAISRQDAEITDVALLVAGARIAQLEAQIEKARSTLEGDLASLGYTRIYAPIAGTVIDVAAFEGQTLNANQTAPTILTIADLSVMTVKADVSEADVSRLRPGMEAYFTTLGQPDRRWTSTVRQVLPQPEILNDVVLYKALLDVDNDGGALLPSMSAQVFFVLGKAEQVVAVPLAALRQRAPADGRSTPPALGARRAVAADDEPRQRLRSAFSALERQVGDRPGTARGMVLVLAPEGTVQPRAVLVGLKTRTAAEIVAGLQPGETVVVGEASARGGSGGSGSGGSGMAGMARAFGGGRR